MGKAIITANHGVGWYTVNEVYDNSNGVMLYEKLKVEKTILDENLISQRTELNEALSQLSLLKNERDQIISDYYND